MHPIAAYLALYGFSPYSYNMGPSGWRIKRGMNNFELQFQLYDFGWSYNQSGVLKQYSQISWEDIPHKDLDLIHPEQLNEFLEQCNK